MNEDLEGWGAADTPLDGYVSEGEINIPKLIINQNQKKPKSGGFQSLGLSHPVLQGILRKGYKIPTPIQRRTIPVILEGRDVVAMARTGSGKTAAFLVPLFERLKIHSAKVGARALIISPTRELALQTLQFAKELGKFTDLRAASILGGEKMELQFAALHDNPDIIFATPGRFMHVCVEMNLKLDSVEYVVFDEADRLFEMGFHAQLKEILARLSHVRQMLLFSATLPKMLVEFARAGLSDPVLIRLDLDTKISDSLKLGFFKVNNEDKIALLIHLLRTVIDASESTIIFAPTKYHVDYLHHVLNRLGISSTCIYSSMDPSARKINIAKFRMKKVNILIVTDIAARGIDIPILDNEINFNFPPRTKLFVHRVGRVARAGRKGTAYSFVAPDEICYLLELHLFLSQSIKFCPMPDEVPLSCTPNDWDRMLGKVPQDIIDDNATTVCKLLEQSFELNSLKASAQNGLTRYVQTRPPPSTESIRRLREELWGAEVGFHPLFLIAQQPSLEQERIQLLEKLKSVRPKETIFEINKIEKRKKRSVKDVTFMTEKRSFDAEKIDNFYKKLKNRRIKLDEIKQQEQLAQLQRESLTASSEGDVLATFKSVIGWRNKGQPFTGANATPLGISTSSSGENGPMQHFIPYLPAGHYADQSYSVMSNFERDSAAATLDLMEEDTNQHGRKRARMQWDRRQMKFKGNDQSKLIKTESGAFVPATCKRGLYRKWRLNVHPRQNRNENQDAAEGDDDDDYTTNEQKKETRTEETKKSKKKKAGFITLNEVTSRNKPHPLLEGKKPEIIRYSKQAWKKNRQLFSLERREKLSKIREEKRQFQNERRKINILKRKKNESRMKNLKRKHESVP